MPPFTAPRRGPSGAGLRAGGLLVMVTDGPRLRDASCKDANRGQLSQKTCFAHIACPKNYSPYLPRRAWLPVPRPPSHSPRRAVASGAGSGPAKLTPGRHTSAEPSCQVEPMLSTRSKNMVGFGSCWICMVKSIVWTFAFDKLLY